MQLISHELTTYNMDIKKEVIETFKDKLIIYRILHLKSNKSYIGKCSKGLNRIIDHFEKFHNPKQDYRAKLLYRAMRKYGKEQFNYQILYIASNEEELNIKEIEFIKMYDTINPINGYNITEGGTGGNTWKNLSEEDLKKAKKRLSRSLKRAWKNKKFNKEKTSKRMSEMRKDPIRSAKNKEVTSKRLKLLNKIDPRFQCKNNIKIRCLETNKVYNSYTETAKDIGVSQGAISFAMKHSGKCKGFTFKKC